jgi:hypothetical protein
MPGLLALVAGAVLLPLAVFTLLGWERIFNYAHACRTDVLKTPALYLEHTGDEDKSIYPIVLATRTPKDAEVCAAIIEPSARRWSHVYLVNDNELAQSLQMLETYADNTTATSEFRYVAVEQGRSTRAGSLDFEHSRKFINDLATYFSERRPDLDEKLNELRHRLGEP